MFYMDWIRGQWHHLRTWMLLLKPIRAWWQCRTHPTSELALRANIASLEVGKNPLEIMAMQADGLPWTKWWHFLAFYEDRLGSVASASRANVLREPVRILEIGVWRGGSMQTWPKYFGDSAIIFGIDIDPNCLEIQGSGGVIRIGAQDDSDFLREVVKEMGGVDIVIDDGSHV